jgi:hypothetical protein
LLVCFLWRINTHQSATGGGHWTQQQLATAIESRSLTAVAEASVAAISVAPHECIAAGYVAASVSAPASAPVIVPP